MNLLLSGYLYVTPVYIFVYFLSVGSVFLSFDLPVPLSVFLSVSLPLVLPHPHLLMRESEVAIRQAGEAGEASCV